MTFDPPSRAELVDASRFMTKPWLDQQANLAAAVVNLVGTWAAAPAAIVASSGTLTTASATVRYKKVGFTVYISAVISIVANGTGAGALILTLPFVNNVFANATISGRETALAGVSVIGTIPANSAGMGIVKYDNTYPGASGALFVLNGTYESAT